MGFIPFFSWCTTSNNIFLTKQPGQLYLSTPEQETDIGHQLCNWKRVLIKIQFTKVNSFEGNQKGMVWYSWKWFPEFRKGNAQTSLNPSSGMPFLQSNPIPLGLPSQRRVVKNVSGGTNRKNPLKMWVKISFRAPGPQMTACLSC